MVYNRVEKEEEGEGGEEGSEMKEKVVKEGEGEWGVMKEMWEGEKRSGYIVYGGKTWRVIEVGKEGGGEGVIFIEMSEEGMYGSLSGGIGNGR